MVINGLLILITESSTFLTIVRLSCVFFNGFLKLDVYLKRGAPWILHIKFSLLVMISTTQISTLSICIMSSVALEGALQSLKKQPR